MTREELTALINGITSTLFGKRVCFFLMLFDLDTNGVAYKANIQRDDLINALKEWITRQEAGLASDPLGQKAQT